MVRRELVSDVDHALCWLRKRDEFLRTTVLAEKDDVPLGRAGLEDVLVTVTGREQDRLGFSVRLDVFAALERTRERVPISVRRTRAEPRDDSRALTEDDVVEQDRKRFGGNPPRRTEPSLGIVDEAVRRNGHLR